MFKRATWLTVGFGIGVGTTVAAARQVRKRVNRYQPRAVANRMTDSLSSLRDQLAAAVDEGRSAAHERELELRARPPRR
ncbi:MAG: hypothetical protein WD271_17155 [Acidimicrobiia bacterium]